MGGNSDGLHCYYAIGIIQGYCYYGNSDGLHCYFAIGIIQG